MTASRRSGRNAQIPLKKSIR
jgi:hypothetical protein